MGWSGDPHYTEVYKLLMLVRKFLQTGNLKIHAQLQHMDQVGTVRKINQLIAEVVKSLHALEGHNFNEQFLKRMSLEMFVAVMAALKAGKIAMHYFRSDKLQVSWKGEDDPLTIADTKAEDAILKTVHAYFPYHEFLGEETGVHDKHSSFKWVVDPIDGTNNYRQGIPDFGVSIALLKGDTPVLGVIFDPVHDDLYLAQAGKGAYLNYKPVHGPRYKGVSNLFIWGIRNKDEPWKSGLLEVLSVLPKHRMEDKNNTTIGMTDVIAGKADMTIKLSVKAWDVVAGDIIAREAGMGVTDCFGNVLKYDIHHVRNYNGFIMCNQKANREIMELISKKRQQIDGLQQVA